MPSIPTAPRPTPWPDDLAWIVAGLKRETVEDIEITPVESGPPRKRLKAKYYVLSTRVELDEPTWKKCVSLYHSTPFRYFSIISPETNERIAVQIREEPFIEKTSETNNGRITRTVRICLVPKGPVLG
jgi:hypothetical protein